MRSNLVSDLSPLIMSCWSQWAGFMHVYKRAWCLWRHGNFTIALGNRNVKTAFPIRDIRDIYWIALTNQRRLLATGREISLYWAYITITTVSVSTHLNSEHVTYIGECPCTCILKLENSLFDTEYYIKHCTWINNMAWWKIITLRKHKFNIK